jgi:hypothetical protein
MRSRSKRNFGHHDSTKRSRIWLGVKLVTRRLRDLVTRYSTIKRNVNPTKPGGVQSVGCIISLEEFNHLLAKWITNHYCANGAPSLTDDRSALRAPQVGFADKSRAQQ